MVETIHIPNSTTPTHTITRINKLSPEWLAIEAWANSELKRYRELNDVPGTDQALTEGYRGSIQVLNDLLELPADEASVEPGQGRRDYGV